MTDDEPHEAVLTVPIVDDEGPLAVPHKHFPIDEHQPQPAEDMAQEVQSVSAEHVEAQVEGGGAQTVLHVNVETGRDDDEQ